MTVPTSPSDESRMLYKILSDGQWHRYREVLESIAKTVPPGRAIRKYEERLEYKRRVRNQPSYDTEATEQERILYGARQLARAAISSWKERFAIQSRGDRQDSEIRLKPGFKVWGMDDLAPEDSGSGGADEDADSASGAAPGSDEKGEGVPSPTPEVSEPPEPVPVVAQEPVVPVVQESVVAEPEPVVKEPVVDWARMRQDLASAGFPPLTVTEVVPFPACARCGSPVADAAIHDLWHQHQDAVSDQVQGAEQAESSQEKLVTLLGDMVDARLDQFQQGMQVWLNLQFAHLEQVIHGHQPQSRRWRDGDAGGSGVRKSARNQLHDQP